MAEWVCNPHGTRVEQEDEPKGTCPEADRSSCFWEKVPTAAITRRSVIEEAQLAYEAHWGQMLLSYPELQMTPWDDQDASVREAWIEVVTPEERSFA